MAGKFKCALLGAPGSGKGTIAMKIIEKYDMYHLSTGDIFRRSIEDRTEMGKTVQKYLSEGKLVPDLIVTRVVLETMKENINRHILLDGFPRNKIQAEKLFMTYPLNLAIHLKVPFNLIIERLSGRWVHPQSGRVYNTVFQPPKKPGVDDVTGEPLIQRPDDAPDTVKARLKLFVENTEPLLSFLKAKNVLKQFEGTTSEEIWVKVDELLMTYIKPKS